MSITIINRQKSNPVADMIGAAVRHYERFNRYIDIVELEKVRWNIFKEWVMSFDSALEIRDEVRWQDLTVKLGSKLQVEPVKITLKKSTLDNPLTLHKSGN
jgi:hypothetical protein